VPSLRRCGALRGIAGWSPPVLRAVASPGCIFWLHRGPARALGGRPGRRPTAL